MELFNKLNSFYEKYNNIIADYYSCQENVFNFKQYEFEIKNRIEKSKNLINECNNLKNNQLKILFNSDIDFHKYYDTKFSNNFNEDKYKKDIVEYLSNKYSNLMINNEKFIERYSSKPSLIEEEYKKQYILEMLKYEDNELAGLNKPLYCLDKKTLHHIDKYNQFTIKSTDINLYPSHSDYLKCVKDRKLY